MQLYLRTTDAHRLGATDAPTPCHHLGETPLRPGDTIEARLAPRRWVPLRYVGQVDSKSQARFVLVLPTPGRYEVELELPEFAEFRWPAAAVAA